MTTELISLPFVRLSSTTLFKAPTCYGTVADEALRVTRKCYTCSVLTQCIEKYPVEMKQVPKGRFR